MNGAQDLGGQHGFGPVEPEQNEPVFHADWERTALAITVLMGPVGGWNIDQSRSARESLPPATYLSSSYYEIWIAALCRLLIERGLATAQELQSGVPATPRAPIPAAIAATDVGQMLARGAPSARPLASEPRFAVGDEVRTRVMNPVGHTRLPRYARGRRGVVARVHGAHVYPDSHAAGDGENPQWLYTVRFDAHAIWGPDTSAHRIHVDCWEPYLEPA
jgi:nitrile hydratase subunit beta